MKNTIKLIGLALIAAIIFSAAACSGGSNGGGGKSLNSAEALKAYLDSRPANSPDKPIKVAMSVNDLLINNVGEVIKSADKFVSLDLTRSAGLTVIGSEVFKGSKALVSINLPNSITGISLPRHINVTMPKTGHTGPGGGKVFYYNANGFTMTDTGEICHYLEAAPNDMPTQLAWASSGYTRTDIKGTETGIGTGRKNTAIILAVDAGAPAAKACKDYSSGGKTDWFLPSSAELNMLYHFRNNVGDFGGEDYWSSSQNSDYRAWYQRFSDGGSYNDYYRDHSGSKSDPRSVRAF